MNRNYTFWITLAIFVFLFSSIFSSIVSAGNICVDNSAPSIPGNIALSDSPFDSDGSVIISWSASTDSPNIDNPDCPGVAYYEIFQKTDNTSDFEKVGQTNELSFVKDGLLEGLTYSFKVRAVDSVSMMPHYGAFTDEVSTTIAALYCGDNVCNNGESCSSCSSDCGVCSSKSSSGSSSSFSSGGLQPTTSLNVTHSSENNSSNSTTKDNSAPVFKQWNGNALNNNATLTKNNLINNLINNLVDDNLSAVPNIQGAVIGGGSASIWPLIVLGVLLVGLFGFVKYRRRN